MDIVKATLKAGSVSGRLCKSLLATLLVSFSMLLSSVAISETETITWVLTDHLGSPVVGRDNSYSGRRWAQDFTPFGERIQFSTFNLGPRDIGYTGHYYDYDMQLLYAGARWYDPRVGRFLSPDVVRFQTGGAVHFNRYAYAANSPYRYVDPTGESPSPADLLSFAQDVGGLLVQEIVYVAAVVNGNDAVAGLAIEGMVEARADAAISTVGLASPVPGTGHAIKAAKGAKASGKARNKPPAPLKEAEGRPHSIIEKPGRDGQYTTHNGDGTWKQYRGSGQDHGAIPRPNVKEAGKNTTPDGREFIDKGRVRPPRSDEIPGG